MEQPYYLRLLLLISEEMGGSSDEVLNYEFYRSGVYGAGITNAFRDGKVFITSSKYKRKEKIQIFAILTVLLTGAAFTDLVKDKIYNFWVIPGLITGFITSMMQGYDRMFESFMAVLVTLLILIPVYLIRGIAGGDVKLFMSAASFMSVQDAMSCILIAFLIAGVLSLAVLIIKKNKKKTIHFAVPVLASVLFVAGGVI